MLSELIAEQMARHQISELSYHALPQQNKLYKEALTRASEKQHIAFINNILPEA